MYIWIADCKTLIAQQDSIKVQGSLPEITIEDFWGNAGKNLGNKIILDSIIKTTLPAVSLSELLASNGSAFPKSYGINGIATISLRGSSAEQVALKWNGINLNNPQLGQTDISLLPATVFESIEIQPNVTLDNLNSSGGTIELRSNEKIDSLFSAQAIFRAASFQDYRGSLKLQKGYKSFGFKLLGYGMNQKNDISYLNPYHNNQRERLEHSKNEQLGTMVYLVKKVRTTTFLYSGWIQNTKRQIPPTFSQAYSDAVQQDYFYRNLLTILFSNCWIKNIDIARLDDQIHFEDLQANIHSFSRSERYVGKVLSKDLIIKNWVNHLDITGEWVQAEVREYQTPKQQLTGTIKGSSIFTNHWLRLQLGAVYQKVTQMKVPLTGAILTEILPFQKAIKGNILFKISLNIAREVRIPTLNDRYWMPGGNPDLLPEESWKQELATNLKFHNFDFQVIAFHRWVNHWIQWIPVGGFFAPVNIPMVRARGLETNFSYQTKFTKGFVRTSITGTLNQITKEKTTQIADASLHKQMIFIPLVNSSFQILLSYKYWQFRLSDVFCGFRYISADNSAFLPSYNLLNFSISRNIRIKTTAWNLAFGVENTLNQLYEIMPGRPMPGITFWYSIQYKLNQNKHN